MITLVLCGFMCVREEVSDNWMVLLLCKSEKNNGEDMSLASN